MKKNYLFLIVTLMLNALMFAQTVTLTPTAVNNTNVNSGPINLASLPTSTISLNVKVEIPSNVAVSDYGTLKIYYSNLSITNANVANGGDSGNLYFGDARTATKSMVINLFWSDFLTSGGFIFAEYKSPAGTVYRSSNIAIIKNSTMNSGTTLNPPADAPNPTKIVNTLCCNQTVRLGEKPLPITGSQYLNPYEKEPYGINSRWTYYGNLIGLDNINKTLSLDYTTQLGTFSIQRSLGYMYEGEFPNKSNVVTITVIPSPLDSNIISLLDTPTDINNYAELTMSNLKEINGSYSVINLNTLQNPSNVPKRSDTYVNIQTYEWEYATAEAPYSWITIPNENSRTLSSSKIPNLRTDKDNFLSIRRIAIYQNLRISSNSLKIVIRTIRNNNTICCDQKLKIISPQEIEKPTLLIGSTAISSKNTELFYQWQKRPINNRETVSNWSNIPGATSKDYLPAPLEYVTNPRGTSIQEYSYRRIAETNYYVGGEISYSNEVIISPSYERSPSSSITVYPNPATSIINIEDKDSVFSLSYSTVTITNITGVTFNNIFSTISPNLLSADISSLIPGTYFINIQTTNNGRRVNLQFTFIKN